MKRKLLLGLLTVMMTASCVAALVACNDGKPDDNTEEHVHNLTYYKSVEPTCTEDGSYEYWHCSGCGKNFTDSDGSIEIDDADLVIEAIVHTWSQWYYKTDDAPTCTEGGKEYRTCEVCTFEESRDVGPRGHIGIKVEEVAAECRKDGMKAHYECERCDGLFLDEACTQPVSEESLTIEATGHTYSDEWKSDANGHWKEATCEHNVTKGPYTHDFEVFDSYEKCRDCGYIVDHKAKIVAKYIAASDLYRLSIDYSQNPEDVWVADFDTVSLPNGEQRVRIDTNLTATDTKYINLKSVDFGELNVVEIGSRAFAGCTSLTEISIPSTVETIDQSAFDGCTNLTKVTFEKGSTNSTALKTIGSQAFSYCAFASIDIPESVTAIEHGAFNFNTALTSIEIPDGVSTLESNMFNGCTALKNVTVPNDITEIGDSAFKNCKALEKFTIPETVTSIGYEAFYGCESLESITIPENVSKLEWDTFYGCSALATVKLPDNLTTIEARAFYNCSQLKEITIPDGVTSIGDQAFAYCEIESATMPALAIRFITSSKLKTVVITSGDSIPNDAFNNRTLLTSVTIPNTVTSIGKAAFADCISLTSITIPESVTSIGNYAFYKCSGLTQINWNAKACEDLTRRNYVFSRAGESGDGIVVNIGKDVTKIPAYLFSPYNNSSSSPKITSIIFDGNSVCTSIGNYAFAYCNTFTSIMIPESVTSIGEAAFAYCNTLTSITIPESVTSIGNYAFDKCSGLTQINWNAKACEDLTERNYVFSHAGESGDGIVVNIGKDVTKIPAYLFSPYDNSYSPKITSIVFDENSVCTSIGNYAFDYCNSLTNITMPNSITSIGNYAFRSCGFESVAIGNGVESIGSEAFAYCHSLTSITIPDSVTNIGYDAFGNCTAIESATMPATAIGSIPTENLKTVVITSGESIAKNAFSYCKLLMSVTLSDSVKNIGSYAFLNCSALESVTIGSEVTSIGSYAFNGCSSLTSISYDGTIEQWNAITKGSDWDDNTGNYTIHCTNGNIEKS